MSLFYMVYYFVFSKKEKIRMDILLTSKEFQHTRPNTKSLFQKNFSICVLKIHYTVSFNIYTVILALEVAVGKYT